MGGTKVNEIGKQTYIYEILEKKTLGTDWGRLINCGPGAYTRILSKSSTLCLDGKK